MRKEKHSQISVVDRVGNMKVKLIIISLIIILIITVVIIAMNNRDITPTVAEEVENSYKNSKFDLRTKIPLEEEYMIQSTWRSCWAYATLDSIETNILLHSGKKYDFSEAHVEYLTSTELAGSRKKDDGGGWITLLEYIAQKKGPVLQQDYPNRIYTPEEYEYLKQAKPIVTSVTTNQFHRNRRKKQINRRSKKTYCAKWVCYCKYVFCKCFRPRLYK